MIDIRNLMKNFPFERDVSHNVACTVPAVAAGGTISRDIVINNEVHFVSESITGWYQTQTAGPVDGGACLISVQIKLVAKYDLFYDAINLASFLSPGRQRASTVAGDPSNALFYPKKFYNLFPARSIIRFNFTSSADLANDVEIVLHGREFVIANLRDRGMKIPRDLQ